ncbi:MAG: D-aminoacyl-tRNA deacylase [Bacillota bacterium]
MKAVIQRVSSSQVVVDQQLVGQIGLGLVILLGVSKEDTKADADYLASKIVNLRIFADSHSKMNLSVKEVQGQLLVVSQFTLCGDCRKGRRPSFVNAAVPEVAEELYQYFIQKLTAEGVAVETGIFQAEMLVQINNNGPVTFVVDSREN